MSDEQKLIEELLRRLDGTPKPKKRNRTLSLTDSIYLEFDHECKRMGKTPSVVIDEFMKLFTEIRRRKQK